MAVFILFTTSAPHPLADALSLQGHQVYEALAVSEVLALVEEHPFAKIIITADVDSTRAGTITLRYPTMQLKPDATVMDIVWEVGDTNSVQ